MTFSLSNLAQSLADYLAPDFPGAVFYEAPNQQDTSCPCLFLQSRFAQVKPYSSDRWLWRIGLDLVYLEDYNLPDLQRRYQAAAEKLDLRLKTFLYAGPAGDTCLMRPLDRRWDIDLEGLHYFFELKIWVAQPDDEPLMQVIREYRQEVR